MPLAEKALIARVRNRAAKTTAIRTGIGDDCAVLRAPAGHEVLITTDFSLEGIHFRREWQPPESVGHRCLARGLSDIAAMGGQPIAAFLSLALPRNISQKWVDDFMHGLLTLADKSSVALAGGDTAESPDGVLVDIVVFGSVPRAKGILRSGARPGDHIFVSGTLGGAAATLRRMMENAGRKLNPRDFPGHFFPQPRLTVGRFLREKALASAMIDVSDGLSTDLGHICHESGVGAEINREALPIACIGRPAREVPLDSALHGGEDYELLFTVPRGKKIPAQIAGVAMTRIGAVTHGKKMILVSEKKGHSELKPEGWQHFVQTK